MAYNPLTVIAEYFPFDAFMFTYNLDAAIVEADEGKALMLDTTGDNKMKLATDAVTIDGRLFRYEDRTQQGGGKVGTVERKLRCKLKYTGTLPVVGDYMCGSATAGIARKRVGGDANAALNCRVIAVQAADSTVTVELF